MPPFYINCGKKTEDNASKKLSYSNPSPENKQFQSGVINDFFQ